MQDFGLFLMSIFNKMRLSSSIISYLKLTFSRELPGSRVYLFGSRTNDTDLGGDIDLMVLTSTPVDKRIFRAIKIEFYKKFGWQKLDLVNFTNDEETAFRKLINTNAIEL